ncbi:MAG TPA: BTAD domain-containing putative transcriptional regulator [Ktedonobacterales bacterium]|nr:BTAD domain-containing putative transcriptional regulator [Ktedonobacterales bacterium]
MPPLLQIRLLGDFGLTYRDEPIDGIHAPRMQSVLAYLVLHSDRPQSRQHLAYMFWPDSTDAQARNNLRQTLHALRLALPDADAFLVADSNTLRWCPDAPYSLDVAAFERALELADAAERQDDPDALHAALEQAIYLYQTDLLPSCYDEWIAPERDRLRQRHLQALDRLIQLLEAQRDYPAAIDYARRMLRHDPLSEDAYCCLMRLLALKGDRAGALRVYHTCAATLQRELGIAPSSATYEAYQSLMHSDGVAAPVEERRPVRTATPSLIGRQRAWDQLQQAWRSATTQGPTFALVSGEAGIGKSRLGDEMLRWAGQHGAGIAKTRCYAAEGQLSLAPVTDWLRSDALRPYLTRLDSVWLTEVARVLPELLSEHPDLPHYEPIGEYGQRQRFFEALARAVLAAPQPLLLLIDDLQWCDQETLEWLHFLLRFDATVQLLILASARTEEITAEHPLRALLLHLRETIGVTEIPLQPLDAAETARLAAIIAGSELNDVRATLLYHETEGNPLFVVETMRAGFDTPHIAEANPAARANPFTGSPAPSAPSLPPRVQAVIAARLAQLSRPARELAALAATIGREFQLDVLVRAGNADEDNAVRALDELWQRRIVRGQGAAAYDFSHDKLREVVYAGISQPQRHLLHRRIAQALEALHASDLDTVSGQIASHYERAGLAEQAIPYYHRAAEVARRVYANDDAITLLLRGLVLLDQLPSGARRDTQELRLLQALAPIYRIIRGWTDPELERVIHRSLVLCETVGDDSQHMDALFGLQSMLVVQSNLDGVKLVAGKIAALSERAQRAVPPLTNVMEAGADFQLGQILAACETFERVIAEPNSSESLQLQYSQGWNYAILSRAWQSHALWCLGYPDRALRRGTEAVQLGRDLELPFNEALAATYLAMLHQLCADAATAREHAEAAYALTIEYKAPYYRVWSAILVAYADAREQPVAPHITRLRDGISEFKASGARLRLPYYLWLLASICQQAGQIESGLAAIDEAMAESQARNERWWDAELHRLRGELLWASSADDGDVEAALHQASEMARAQQAKSLELRAAMSLARWWHARSRADEARHLLSDVYAWFTEGFDTPDLRAARSLLAELA